jgi:hypothetical protein
MAQLNPSDSLTPAVSHGTRPGPVPRARNSVPITKCSDASDVSLSPNGDVYAVPNKPTLLPKPAHIQRPAFAVGRAPPPPPGSKRISSIGQDSPVSPSIPPSSDRSAPSPAEPLETPHSSLQDSTDNTVVLRAPKPPKPVPYGEGCVLLLPAHPRPISCECGPASHPHIRPPTNCSL